MLLDALDKPPDVGRFVSLGRNGVSINELSAQEILLPELTALGRTILNGFDRTIVLPKVASLTGAPDITRMGRVCWNTIGYARACAEDALESDLGEFIVVWLADFNSVVAVRDGSIVDCNDWYAHGPFSLLAAGGLPASRVAEICSKACVGEDVFADNLVARGGIRGYLGVDSFEQVDSLAKRKDADCMDVLAGMVHQLAKEVGSMVAALGKTPELIIIGGPGSLLESILRPLIHKIERFAPLFIVSDEQRRTI